MVVLHKQRVGPFLLTLSSSQEEFEGAELDKLEENVRTYRSKASPQ